ncbi:DMT family transporter [Pseudomonas songnenensis]|uniref:EamA family transporter n=1 Tax=Pseudomonas songnenensis TaxID=1176259 RepID=A0ABX9UPR7_9PSED|nr:DMT family transporter [Pseudomonas songnenensis]MCQ4299391.1 DMT family transporter [Pseudomonas songnenensis]RMH94272.1 EamA family transporter [Pseudomonas songnenensis]
MRPRTLLLTALAMLAFAGNSILCRIALRDTTIDPASFTGLRILAGALMLWLLLRLSRDRRSAGGDWLSALALFVYAASFSFAYINLDAGAGALLLFGAVQLSMLVWGLLSGERFSAGQMAGLLLALSGLLILLLPGSRAPALEGALLMLLSGVAWGIYSLRGRGASNPLAATAGNFIKAVPFAAVLCLVMLGQQQWDAPGVVYALLSGALASGVGYAIWYAALPGLAAVQAASVQLSVPLLTAIAGAALLGEALTPTLIISGAAILGGIAMVLGIRHRG